MVSRKAIPSDPVRRLTVSSAMVPSAGRERMFRPVATFSIVARDPKTESLGVAVQSKFLAVGSVVPWAKAGVGAIATQAWANPTYGPRGLELLQQGFDAGAVVKRLTAEDEGREHRQLGVVDAQGRAHAYTGSQCHAWAGHVVGEGFACQGNILAGEGVVTAMAEAFTASDGDLATRLLAALQAGQRAGGDRRGRQSAAILIVREGAGYGGFTDRYMDLRVDDHPEPIDELERLVSLFRLYFEKEESPRVVRLEGSVLEEVRAALEKLGYVGQGEGSAGGHREESGPGREPEDSGSGGERKVSGSVGIEPALKAALHTFYGVENFEERVHGDDVIDEVVLRFLLEKARSA